jgi:hypothetical protein
VTLEIDAEIPEGAPDHVVRAVTENSRTLKFANHGSRSHELTVRRDGQLVNETSP